MTVERPLIEALNVNIVCAPDSGPDQTPLLPIVPSDGLVWSAFQAISKDGLVRH